MKGPVVDSAAGDLCAVERDAGHLGGKSAAGHLDVVERDTGDFNAVET